MFNLLVRVFFIIQSINFLFSDEDDEQFGIYIYIYIYIFRHLFKKMWLCLSYTLTCQDSEKERKKKALFKFHPFFVFYFFCRLCNFFSCFFKLLFLLYKKTHTHSHQKNFFFSSVCMCGGFLLELHQFHLILNRSFRNFKFMSLFLVKKSLSIFSLRLDLLSSLLRAYFALLSEV